MLLFYKGYAMYVDMGNSNNFIMEESSTLQEKKSTLLEELATIERKIRDFG